jgi:type IV pilus assembly protein PilO
MNTIQEYRNPILIGVVGVVVAIILYALVYSPQNSKLSTLKTQETSLTAQEAALQTQLTLLQSEKQKLPANCADLQKISTQIPSVQQPGDLAAEQASFYDQLTALVQSSGTTIPTFAFTSGPAASSGTTATTTPASGSSSAGGTSAGVVPVGVSMTITGDFSQMSAFVGGLDSFPRLFVIQNFTLSLIAAGTSTSGGSSTSGASATPLWQGGTATAPTAGPYSLAIAGSIYYTTSPSALAACTKAGAA